MIANLREAERILNRATTTATTTTSTAMVSAHAHTTLRAEDFGFLILSLSKIEQNLSIIPERGTTSCL